MPASAPSDFDQILPTRITEVSVQTPDGHEWVMPLAEVRHAIQLASDHLSAVLGVESFRILDDGLGTEGYTGYAFDLQGDWQAFVHENNAAAFSFIEENPLGSGYGYILTATSEHEFKHLRDGL